MDTKSQADAIRESWTRWLANADDAAVIRFHQQVIDRLESERDVDAAEVMPFGYGVINRQLLDNTMDELAEESEIRKARDLVGHRYRQESYLKAAISLEMWRQSQNAEERVSGEAEMAKLDPDLRDRARSIVSSLTADERAACGLLPT
jgi:hypothetical protein